MSMLEERIKRSAKKAPAAPARQAEERVQRAPPGNPNASMTRKPAPDEAPNKLKYAMPCSPEQKPRGSAKVVLLLFYLSLALSSDVWNLSSGPLSAFRGQNYVSHLQDVSM